jgi:hypothetical protein
MTSGRYFNRGVMTLDSPYIGHVVRETDDTIVVFGPGEERFDVPKSEIKTTGRNVLLGLNVYDLVKKYKVSRDMPLPTNRRAEEWSGPDLDLASYEGKYPNSLFNKGVRAKNEDHVGHVMKETSDKIVVFGSYNHRFDIPKSEIYQVGMNVILKIDFPDIFKYQKHIDDPLPEGQSVNELENER